MNRILILLFAMLLNGCVTETSGPQPPQAASLDDQIQALVDLGMGYVRNRDYIRAKEALSRALEIDPSSRPAHNAFALVHQVEGDYDLAEYHFKRATTDRTYSRAYNNYGAFLFSQGRFQEAVDKLEVAAEDTFYENRALVFENLGVAYNRLGDREKAEQAFVRAARLNPRMPRALLELAHMRFDEQNFVESRQYYRQFVSVSEQSARSLLLCVRLSRIFSDADSEASCALSLRNIFPASDEYKELEASGVSETLDATNNDERSASQLLSEARVAMGLSQEQVAQELYLIPSYIVHIDNDEIEKIDKQAFVRGYLRSYAKLVNLDGDDMVARFDKTNRVPTQEIEIRGVTQEPVGSTNFTGPVIQTAVMGLIGFVVVVSLVWFLVSSGEEEIIVATTPERPAPEQTAPQVDLQLVPEDEATLAEFDAAPEFLASEPATDLAETTPENALSDEVNDAIEVEPLVEAAVEEARDNIETEIATQLPGDTSDDFLIADVADAEDEVEQAGEALVDDVLDLASKAINIERIDGVIRVDAGGSDELSFSFTDECWVEIEDGEGHAIYGDLNRSGDQLIVTGLGPFEVLFGKAPAVTMMFNGEPFDLVPHTTSVDTAKVKVGN